MVRDPFYREIITRLKSTLDDELFEQCVADILRVIYPTLVPIRGGADSGMDGAIADGKGEPFPVVTTTAKNVIGNLTRNLKSYLKDDGKRRRVILATSQYLTPPRKRNLYKRAEELGFTLINIYDQDAVANLLYRDSRWCQELLNLTGDPPALSAIPKTERPLLNHALIGREADLVWLRQIDSDGLLVGQPGSGKTFLLYKLVLEGKGLFAVSKGRGEIAACIRTEQPSALIVDDAQVNRELLVDLQQMRRELGAKFSILASCWPGDKEVIAQTLNLSKPGVRDLGLLTRPEIVEVIEATGIRGPNDLIRELVNQAEGRPGLAVTLAHLCIQGGVREVALGDALSNASLKFFEPVIGQAASEILASFSVGDDAGMSMEPVANALELTLLNVRHTVAKLAAGGVILDVDGQHLSVRPPALRHALVRDVFFKDAMSLPIDQFLELLAHAPDLSASAYTLIGAKARGAIIPQELLIAVVEKVNSPNVWKGYAQLGCDEATWILENHPEKLIPVSRSALQQIPQVAIPLLLKEAIGDQRPLNATPDHPFRLIEEWVLAGYPGTGEALERRRVLSKAARAWLLDGDDIEVGLYVLQFVLTPNFGDYIQDPGMGNTITIRRGCLLRDEILAVQDLWPQVLDAIKTAQFTDWTPIRNMAEAWVYPGRFNIKVPPETYQVIRTFAGQMLHDVVLLAENHPGVLHWTKQISENLDLGFEIPLDQDFEILYPQENYNDFDDWEATAVTQRCAVRELASAWSKLNPEQVVKHITWIEQEARLADIRSWPRWTPLLCAEIAGNVNSPDTWIRVMIETKVTSDLIGPFLRRAAEMDAPGWEDLVANCLDHPTLGAAAISLVLTLPDPPEDLLSKVLIKIEGYAQSVRLHCLRNQVSEKVLKQLLRHQDPSIASAAAIGEWNADPEGTVSESILKDWQDAVINQVSDGFWLGKILANDSLLAYEWLQTRATEPFPVLLAHEYEKAVKAAVEVLDVNARRSILRQVPETYEYGRVGLVTSLIGDDIDFYRELLKDKGLKQFHLAPLSGYPEGIWVDRAKAALDAGYSSKEIALAVHYSHGLYSVEWIGSESKMWSGWVERFEKLCSHQDERIQKVGKIGRAHAKAALERAQKDERNEAIYGEHRR